MVEIVILIICAIQFISPKCKALKNDEIIIKINAMIGSKIYLLRYGMLAIDKIKPPSNIIIAIHKGVLLTAIII